jgi:predicted secreted protein
MAKVLTQGPLRLRSGETAEIAADGHGIGGYLWSASVVAGKGRVTPLAPEPAGGIGGGAVIRFRLEWQGKAGGTVRLSYGRSWQGSPEKTEDIAVDVAD